MKTLFFAGITAIATAGAFGGLPVSAQTMTQGSGVAEPLPQISKEAAAGYAADMPVKAPRGAPIGYSNGVYVWADGSYQSMSLPHVNLGLSQMTTPLQTFGQQFASFDPRADGYGVRGGIGYIFRDGTFPRALGSNARIELNASYVRLTDSQSAISTLPGTLLFQHVDGRISFFGGCITCTVASSLNSLYDTWYVNLKGASDFRTGNVTLTPSIIVFGGRGRNNQDFLQTAGPPFAPPFNNYQIDSRLSWTDWGARAGLDMTVDITPTVAFGLGGNIGFASRRVSLSATEPQVLSALADSFATSATVTPFLANAEASVSYKPWAMTTVKVFGGLDYDSKVPGTLAPTWFSPAFGFVSALSPMAIAYAHETRWYVGGGVAMKFAQ
jgi:hypothetical protein